MRISKLLILLISVVVSGCDFSYSRHDYDTAEPDEAILLRSCSGGNFRIYRLTDGTLVLAELVNFDEGEFLYIKGRFDPSVESSEACS